MLNLIVFIKMDIETLKTEVLKTGYLENKKVGLTFHVKYPILFEKINTITHELTNSFIINQSFRSRTIFLLKYDLDIKKIKKSKSWLTFDRKIDDFIDKTGDYRKRGWDKLKNNIPNEIFTKNETINFLLENDYYLSLFGKSKNRKILKDNPKLYNSIYKHTEFMDNFNKNNKKFTNRILVLVKYNGDINNIICKTCKKNHLTINWDLNILNELCYNCFHINNENKYPQKGWFHKTYGDDWEQPYEKFIYDNTIKLHKNNGFSKISQNIFWEIYKKLNDNQKKKCFFKELNNEWYISHKDCFYFVDFICGKKIIEFDGVYWHKNTTMKDIKRNENYIKLGYDLLIISENDLIDKKNKFDNIIIDRCVKFINDEN